MQTRGRGAQRCAFVLPPAPRLVEAHVGEGLEGVGELAHRGEALLDDPRHRLVDRRREGWGHVGRELSQRDRVLEEDLRDHRAEVLGVEGELSREELVEHHA